MLPERTRLISTIQNRQCNYIGHVLRRDSLLRDIIEGRMQGSKGKAGTRTMLLDWMTDKDKNAGYRQLTEEASNRQQRKKRAMNLPKATTLQKESYVSMIDFSYKR